MPAVTVLNIIQRARDAADMRDDFPTQAEFLRWLNADRPKLEALILRSGYVLREARSDITATGAQQYNISDPLAILGVYEIRSDGAMRRIRHSDLADGAGRTWFGGTTAGASTGPTGPARQFRAFQNTNGNTSIQFYPRPTSGTYTVIIVDEPVALTLADSVNYPAGLEEWLVLSMARRAVAKEEGDTRELTRQLAEQELYVERFCWDRVAGGHAKVRNVDRVERGWEHPSLLGYPSRDEWYWP